MIHQMFKNHRKTKLRRKWASLFGFTAAQTHTERHNELSYLAALNEFKRCHDINIPLYPFGAAANSSLLYVVARALSSYSFDHVLELGCGQTSFLIDAIRKQFQREFNVTSLEENGFWQKQIQDQIDYSITHSDLTHQQINHRNVSFYSGLESHQQKRFDFILVDGPIGTPEYSRYGSLHFIEHNLADDFVIVFDDAHRLGELQTVREALQLLDKKGHKYKVSQLQALKHQVVIASPKYEGACYF